MSGHINSSDLNYINYKQKLDAVLRQCKQHEIRMQYQRRNFSNQSRSKSRSQEKLNKPQGFNQNLSINTNFDNKQQNCYNQNSGTSQNSNFDSTCNLGNEASSKRFRSITTTNSALLHSNSKKLKQISSQTQQNHPQQQSQIKNALIQLQQQAQQQSAQQQQQKLQMNFSQFFINQNKQSSKKNSNKHVCSESQIIQPNISSSSSMQQGLQKQSVKQLQQQNKIQQQLIMQQQLAQICNQETDSANQICQLLQKLIQTQQQEHESVDFPTTSSSNRFSNSRNGQSEAGNLGNNLNNQAQQQQQQQKSKVPQFDIRTSQKINPLELDEYDTMQQQPQKPTLEEVEDYNEDECCQQYEIDQIQVQNNNEFQQQQLLALNIDNNKNNNEEESEELESLQQRLCSTLKQQNINPMSAGSGVALQNQNLLQFIAVRENEIEKKYKDIIRQYITQNQMLSSELAKLRQTHEGKENKVKELQNELRRLRKEKEEEIQKNSKLEENLLVEREKNIELERKLEDISSQLIYQQNNLQKFIKDNPETKLLQKQLQELLKEKDQLEDVLKNFLLERELQKMHENIISNSNSESNCTATPCNLTQNIDNLVKKSQQKKLIQSPEQQDGTSILQSKLVINNNKNQLITDQNIDPEIKNFANNLAQSKRSEVEQQHEDAYQQESINDKSENIQYNSCHDNNGNHQVEKSTLSNQQDEETEMEELSRVDENEELFAFTQNVEINNGNPSNLNELLNSNKQLNKSHFDSVMAISNNNKSEHLSKRQLKNQSNSKSDENEDINCNNSLSSKYSSQREPFAIINDNVNIQQQQLLPTNSKKPSKQFALDLSKLQSNLTYQNQQLYQQKNQLQYLE